MAGVGDFDQNGCSDIVLRDGNQNVEVIYFQAGGTTLTVDYPHQYLGYASTSYYNTQWPKTTGKFDANWNLIGVGDFQGTDSPAYSGSILGTGDIAVGSFNHFEPVNGFNSLVPQDAWGNVFARVPATLEFQALGDFNGAGSKGILWRNKATGQISIWYMGYFGGDLYTPGPVLLPGLSRTRDSAGALTKS